MGSRYPYDIPSGTERSSKWGPTAWRKFHIKALTYPANPCSCDIKKIEHFYNSTFPQYILCDTCTEHYKRILREIPIDARTMITLFQWTIDVHNRVNRRLGRSTITYAEAFEVWLDKVNTSYPDAGFFCQTIGNPFAGPYPISY